MAFWKRQNYGNSKKMGDCQRSGAETDAEHGVFWAVKLFCVTLTEGTCHYTFVEAHRMYNTNSEP